MIYVIEYKKLTTPITGTGSAAATALEPKILKPHRKTL
jgi:hypothetical protein